MKAAKPFVKWAGGKSQLIPEIAARMPHDIAVRDDMVYVEPFVGGGAVLFWILQQYPNIRRAVINDINPDLMMTYRVVKMIPEQLISELAYLQRAYDPLGEGGRKVFFLERRAAFNAGEGTEPERAALFIFLNKTCYNGLYRVNSKGGFNVPHGRYAHPNICDAETIWADAELLQRVELLCDDFSVSERFAGAEALYYFDPPYKPLSRTSSFTSYSVGHFGDPEQIRLRDFCDAVSERGSRFILSNSDLKVTDADNEFFDELYQPFHIDRVQAVRCVNVNALRRGHLSELMITNY